MTKPELPALALPARWVHPGIAAAAVVAAAILVTRLLPGLNMPSQERHLTGRGPGAHRESDGHSPTSDAGT